MSETKPVILNRHIRTLGGHELGVSWEDPHGDGITHPVGGEPDLWCALPREEFLKLQYRAEKAEDERDDLKVALRIATTSDSERNRRERAEAERDAARAALKDARAALKFYASGHPNAFRCASERMGIGQGPCCERVIDAGGIAQQALDKIRALLGPAHDTGDASGKEK